MDGLQIYEKKLKEGGDYAQFLQTALLNVGEEPLFKLLETAERDGAILELNEKDLPDEWDGFGADAIVLKKIGG